MVKKIIIAVLFALSILLFSNNLFAQPATSSTQTSYVDTFNQADSNQDGYLSSDEVSQAGLLDDESFKKADTDGDGLVSLGEAKQINLAPPKVEKAEEEKASVEEESPDVQKEEETEPKEEAEVTTPPPAQTPAQIPPEIKKEQEKLGVVPKEAPAAKARPKIPALHHGGTGPARSIQSQKGLYPPRTAVGALGNAMSSQKAGRIPRRPPSFVGRRIPKPPTTTMPTPTMPTTTVPTTAPGQSPPDTSGN